MLQDQSLLWSVVPVDSSGVGDHLVRGIPDVCPAPHLLYRIWKRRMDLSPVRIQYCEGWEQNPQWVTDRQVQVFHIHPHLPGLSYSNK